MPPKPPNIFKRVKRVTKKEKMANQVKLIAAMKIKEFTTQVYRDDPLMKFLRKD